MPWRWAALLPLPVRSCALSAPPARWLLQYPGVGMYLIADVTNKIDLLCYSDCVLSFCVWISSQTCNTPCWVFHNYQQSAEEVGGHILPHRQGNCSHVLLKIIDTMFYITSSKIKGMKKILVFSWMMILFLIAT